MRGSKPGERRGGRRKGTPNKVSAARAAGIAASGLTPLDYLLSVVRDEKEERSVRMTAARDAAPYCHNRLAAIEHTGKDGAAIEVKQVTDLELARWIAWTFTKAERELDQQHRENR